MLICNSDRIVPEWFQESLRHIDPALIVYYNPIRNRWVIDRCTRDDNMLHSHDATCPKTNVRVVQEENGSYMPLCQEVLDWFKKNDVGSQHASADDLIRKWTNEHQRELDKLKETRRGNTRHATLDGKRQLQQAKNLIDQHGLDNCEADRIKKFERAERQKQQPVRAAH